MLFRSFAGLIFLSVWMLVGCSTVQTRLPAYSEAKVVEIKHDIKDENEKAISIASGDAQAQAVDWISLSEQLENLASLSTVRVRFTSSEVDSLRRSVSTNEGKLPALKIATALLNSQSFSKMIQFSNQTYAYGLEIILSKMEDPENKDIGNLLADGRKASQAMLSENTILSNARLVRAMTLLLRSGKAQTSEQAWAIVHPEKKLPNQNSNLYSPDAILTGAVQLPTLKTERVLNYLKTIEMVPSENHFEHDVYHDLKTNMAIKLTLPSALSRGAQAYLQRLHIGNDIFGDQIRVAGWVQLPGEAERRLVVVQPWIEGRPSTQVEIDVYMKAHGFEKAMDGAYGGGTQNFWVTDVLPKNVRTDSNGIVHIIDFKLPTLSLMSEEYFQSLLDAQFFH